jgi:hypothetical protein
LDLGDRDHGMQGLEMIPLRLRKFRLNRSAAEEVVWAGESMDHLCGAFANVWHGDAARACRS